MKQYFLPLALTTFLLSSCGLAPTNQPNQNQTVTPSEQTSVKKSLRDLLSLGVAQKCSWSFSNEKETMTGEVVISGQKLRQTATINFDGKVTKSNVVSDGDYVYIWNDEDKKSGLKMKADATTNESGNSAYSINWDEQYDYNCVPSTVSDADFAAPSDIVFTDLSELQNQMKNLNLDALKDLAPTE